MIKDNKNTDRQYFQHLVGSSKGSIVYKTGEDEVMDTLYYTFSDGSRMRYDLVGEVDDEHAYSSGGCYMAELSHPENKWKFVTEKNPLYQPPQYATTEDGKRYEIPNVDGSLPSEVPETIEVAKPPINSKVFARRFKNKPHKGSTSSVIKANEIEEHKITLDSTYNITVPKGELVIDKELEKKLDEKLEKLFADFVGRNNIEKPKEDNVPEHIKILADNIKRTNISINIDLEMQLPSISTINILKSDTFNSDEEYKMFIKHLVDNIDKDEIIDIIKTSIKSVYDSPMKINDL